MLYTEYPMAEMTRNPEDSTHLYSIPRVQEIADEKFCLKMFLTCPQYLDSTEVLALKSYLKKEEKTQTLLSRYRGPPGLCEPYNMKAGKYRIELGMALREKKISQDYHPLFEFQVLSNLQILRQSVEVFRFSFCQPQSQD